MGRGSRHSKNAGVMGSEAMTYAEMKTLGYGTAYERLGKESIGNFDDCRLTLQTANDPVCTPAGIIYSKKAILEALIYQKKNIKRKLEVWDDFEKKEGENTTERLELKEHAKLVEFERLNHMGWSLYKAKKAANKILENKHAKEQIIVSGGVNIDVYRERMKELKSFWGRSVTPNIEPTPSLTQGKSKNCTICPITGAKLRLKDLIPLKFTRAPVDNHATEPDTKYMDPISRDIFTNCSRLVCLRSTGEVILYDTFKKFVEPEETRNGFVTKDIIELQNGGTGYVAHDGKALNASKHTFLGLGSGMTDMRGQHSGSGVKSGLVLI